MGIGGDFMGGFVVPLYLSRNPERALFNDTFGSSESIRCSAIS